MKILVEDLQIGNRIVHNEEEWHIENTFEVNGEGRGFVLKNRTGKEKRVSAACGTSMERVDATGGTQTC